RRDHEGPHIRRSRDRPRTERPARRRHGDHRVMPSAGRVEKSGRAIMLTPALVGVAGAVSSLGLASSIYPRLEFPRVVIIGHSGTPPARTMVLSVAAPRVHAAS